MNSVLAEIKSVTSSGKVHLAQLGAHGLIFSVILLESPLASSQPGEAVQLLFKETEVSVGLSAHMDISLRNRIPGTISLLEKGSILCRISLTSVVGEIEAIITRASADGLQLTEGMQAVAYIKSNDIMLARP